MLACLDAKGICFYRVSLTEELLFPRKIILLVSSIFSHVQDACPRNFNKAVVLGKRSATWDECSLQEAAWRGRFSWANRFRVLPNFAGLIDGNA